MVYTRLLAEPSCTEAHQQLEELVLDRATYEVKEEMGNKLSQVVYEGKWFTPLREAIQAFIESTQEYVTGEVKFKLYKGNIIKSRYYFSILTVQRVSCKLHNR